jgi:hypothetical protein
MWYGEWGVCIGWSWRDEWVWGLVRDFMPAGLLFLVLGPVRVSFGFPIEAADSDEDACTVSQVSTPA